MTVIRPNSISGVTSITAQGGDITYFKSDGTAGNQFTHNIQSTGVITATKFVGPLEGNVTGSVTGSGANLTSIPAGNLTGTVADARISTLTASKLTGALPAISGSNLTGLTANSIGALAGITIRKDDGVVGSANSVSSINFVGAAVTFTNPTSGIATVTISSGGDSASPVMMSMIFG